MPMIHLGGHTYYSHLHKLPVAGFSITYSPLCLQSVSLPSQIMGQNADLFDLQRILLRAKNKMSDAQQQNMTRWAVFSAGGILKQVCQEVQLVALCGWSMVCTRAL